MKAHSTAIVDPSAEVAGDVEIGPYCVVGPRVRIGEGCRLLARVIVSGAAIGCRNLFHPNVVIGTLPQAAGPAAPDGRIEIGDDNILREASSVNLAATAGGVTRIGSRNRFHPCASVGPDCAIGDGVVLGTFGALRGRNDVGDRAWIEGSGGAETGVSVSRGGWIQSHCCTIADVPPFMGVAGDLGAVFAVNPQFRTPALERALELVWRSNLPRVEAIRRLEGENGSEIAELVAFLRRPPREPVDE